MSGSEWSRAPLGETAPVASEPNSSELGNNYNNNPPPLHFCSVRRPLFFSFSSSFRFNFSVSSIPVLGH